jgi:hypothetical protein
MGVDAGIDLDTGIVLLNLMSNGLNGQNTAISRSVPTVMAGTRSFTDHSAVQVYKRTDIPGATYPFTPWIMKDYYGSLWASTCALSPDGRYLAVGIMSYTLTGATGVDIYDLSLPSQDRIARIQPFPTAALEKTITKIAFIDGTTLACTASVSDNNRKPSHCRRPVAPGPWASRHNRMSPRTHLRPHELDASGLYPWAQTIQERTWPS